MDNPILEIKNLQKNFGDQQILDHFSLQVEEGEVLVILGPSGCGKSTLLRCINGLEEIQGGEIFLRGENISDRQKNMHEIRQKIGMVFQSYELFPHMTVMENLLLGPIQAQKRKKAEVEKEAEELLDRVGLLDKKNSYPRELSGGQKQRVAILRALCMHPEVILFDEVTAALDPEMVREVLEVISDLAKEGRTMLLVTHEMQSAKAIADRIIFMDGGKIVEENSPEIFFQNPETERAKQFLHVFDYEEM